MIDLNDNIFRVKLALTDHLYEQGGEKLEALEPINIVRRPFSVITFLRVQTSKGLRRLVMKSTVHHALNKEVTGRENQAVVEYNVLKSIYSEFERIPKMSVPRPVLVVPEIETYLMEFVSGPLLANELRFARYLSSRRRFEVLKQHFFHCGLWLKHFQEFTGVSVGGPKYLDGVVERCTSRLRVIEKLGDRRWPKNLRSKVVSMLDEQKRELSRSEFLISGRHGDYGPWNIVAGSDGITVIDFLGYQKDPVPVDLLKMLVHLEDEKMCLSSSSKRVEVLKERFLEGYGKLPSIPLPVLIICETMQRTVSLGGNISIQKPRFRHGFEANLCVKAHIEWLNSGGRKTVLWPS